MENSEFQQNLKNFNLYYEAIITGEKAKHNITIFCVNDMKLNNVIASITPNGDLKLNDKYKHNKGLMNTIITFFTSNAKVENTYNY